MLLISSGFIHAQSPTFFKKYGGSGTDEAHSVALTSDGGYIIAGRTASFGIGSSDIYLIRTDSLGDTVWTNTYGTVHFDAGFSVQETYDGGFVVAGQHGEPDTLSENLSDVFIFKTNPQGETDWTFSWNAGLGDRAFSVRQTTDSCYIIAGVLNSAVNFGNPTSFLLKLDNGGDSLWTRFFESPSIVKSVLQTLDGGYIFCGQYGMPPATVAYLVKTNSLGDTIWTKKGGFGFQFGWSEDVVQTSDGNFIITGTVFDGLAKSVFLTKTDESGNTVWTKYYGGTKDDFGYAVDIVDSEGFIITGGTFSYSTGQFTNADIWLVRTDNNGDTLWTRSYGSTENEEGFCVKSCNDGGYVITGYTGVQPDIFLLKTDSLGDAPTITSIENSPPTKSPAIHVYPNPSRDWVTIEFEGSVSDKDMRFSLYGLSGEKIGQLEVSSVIMGENHYRLNVEDLAKGIYFLRIDFGDTTQFTKLLRL
jgi:hypothetical protein